MAVIGQAFARAVWGLDEKTALGLGKRSDVCHVGQTSFSTAKISVNLKKHPS